jgi:hypothetical protein
MVSLELTVCVSGRSPRGVNSNTSGEPGAGKLVPVSSRPFVAAESDLAKQRARRGREIFNDFAFSTLTSLRFGRF